jgi:hypothetical protein
MTTQVQNETFPNKTTTSSLKSLLSKKEKMTIQSNMTTEDPTTTIQVRKVQLGIE